MLYDILKFLVVITIAICASTFGVAVGIATIASDDLIHGRAVALALGSAMVGYLIAITFAFVRKP